MTTYNLYEDGTLFGSLEADSLDDAIAAAEQQCQADTSMYDTSRGSVAVEIVVRNDETDEQGYVTFAVRQPEPKCADGHTHDWIEQSTQGNGGGVIIVDLCRHCGCQRITNTWAELHIGKRGTDVTYTQAHALS